MQGAANFLRSGPELPGESGCSSTELPSRSVRIYGECWKGKRTSVQPAATPTPVESLYFSTTEASGSSQKPQTTEPRTSRPAATMNGAAHEPNWAKTPKTNGESAPPMFPAMFIIPDTVPEYLSPTSRGTARAVRMVHSRKNMAPVKKYRAMYASAVNAAGTMNTTQPNMPVMATARRANLVLPVFFKSQSVARPPTVSPTTPAQSGSEANSPTLSSVNCRNSIR